MENNICIFCENGVIFVANGPDDSQPEYCSVCSEGRKLAFFDWFRSEKAKLVTKVSV